MKTSPHSTTEKLVMAYPVCISVPGNNAPPTDGEVYIKHLEFFIKDGSRSYRVQYKKLEKTLLFEYLRRDDPSFLFHERVMTVSFKIPMAEAESVLKRTVFCEEKRYRFLGCSESQIRQKTCYLINESEGKIDDLLAKFDDFFGITDLRLRARRIGLLFATFDQSLELDEDDVKVEQDIETGMFREHTYTDGCGFMSPHFSSRLRDQLQGVNYPEPSAVLVRYQGFEGMLVLKKEHTNIPQVQFHRSMQKFAIPKAMRQALSFICIVDHSRPNINGYLDARLIMLLMARGVSVANLKSLQKDYFNLLKRMCEDQGSADYFLRVTGGGARTDQDLPALRQAEIEKMIDYHPGEDPPRGRVVRTRILVPKARVVFGVCDPYKRLEHGECYFKPTLLHDEREEFAGVTEVVVARSPCYHPGDILVFKLTHEKPEYEQLTDCLVLPLKGPSPRAFECGGGDLGGIQFFVSWEPYLIPKNNVNPYSCLPTPISNAWGRGCSCVPWLLCGCLRKSRRGSREEMLEYFARFTDDLPNRIDKAYMKFAKASDPSSKECEQLSKMFYQANNLTVDENVLRKRLEQFEQMEPRGSVSSTDHSETEMTGLLESAEEGEASLERRSHGFSSPSNQVLKEFEEEAERFVEEVQQE